MLLKAPSLGIRQMPYSLFLVDNRRCICIPRSYFAIPFHFEDVSMEFEERARIINWQRSSNSTRSGGLGFPVFLASGRICIPNDFFRCIPYS